MKLLDQTLSTAWTRKLKNKKTKRIIFIVLSVVQLVQRAKSWINHILSHLVFIEIAERSAAEHYKNDL